MNIQGDFFSILKKIFGEISSLEILHYTEEETKEDIQGDLLSPFRKPKEEHFYFTILGRKLKEEQFEIVSPYWKVSWS